MLIESSKWLYFLGQLKVAKVSPNDLVLFYTTCLNILVNNWLRYSSLLPSALIETSCIDYSARRQLQHWVGRFLDFTPGVTP